MALRMTLVIMTLTGAAWSVAARAQTPAVSKPRVAVMVLRPHGFEPSLIEVTAGRVLLAVFNRTGLDEVKLRITRQTGADPSVGVLLREERLILGKRMLGLNFDLVPGSYVVTEANQPSWRCRVIVKLPRN